MVLRRVPKKTMTYSPIANQRFLTALFGGEFPGHALIMAMPGASPIPGDFTVNDEPIGCRVNLIEREYERECRFHEAVGDDSVPFANLHTGTGIFAAAFGCPIVEFEGSNPASQPIVHTAAEADALSEPDPWSSPLGRHLELVAAVRDRLGADIPVSGPDMQSPLGLAAQIWEKAEFMSALIEEPEIAREIIRKCHNLVKNYLIELRKIAPNMNAIHCPRIWGPAELGASVSEDEVGAISRAMYEEFGLRCLIDLSETFGGLYMHCCASADHQYPAFQKIPNLRGLNRVYQSPGAKPALDAFGGRTVHMEWGTLETFRSLLDFDAPGVRFAFCYSPTSIDDAKRTLEVLRKWCPRT